MEGYSVAYFPHNLGEISSIIDATDFSVKKFPVLSIPYTITAMARHTDQGGQRR
jgi:hypothetical protein